MCAFRVYSIRVCVRLCMSACVRGGGGRHLWASLIKECAWAKLLFLRSHFKAGDIEGLFWGWECVGLPTALTRPTKPGFEDPPGQIPNLQRFNSEPSSANTSLFYLLIWQAQYQRKKSQIKTKHFPLVEEQRISTH